MTKDKQELEQSWNLAAEIMKNFSPVNIACVLLMIFFTNSCLLLKKKNTETPPVDNSKQASQEIEKNYIKQELIVKVVEPENVLRLEEQYSEYKL
jgi:hypothetical protein